MEGTVIKSTGSWMTVLDSEGEIYNCKLKGKFRIKGIKSTNPVAVGDNVLFDLLKENNIGLIKQILPRHNYIIRKATKLSKVSHIIAANIDQALLIVTLAHPRTSTGFIDRFLVSAEAYRIPVIILFNKTDLYGKAETMEMEELWSIYTAVGYKCLKLSLQTREGINEVKEEMIGKVNVISGNSGVGKSTLINILDPTIRLKIGDISEYHQAGKHTTTFAEMFELDSGIRIIDTPGIRGFGTIDIERSELFHFFPEIFRASKLCRYHNCMHLNEPDCGVKRAVGEGSVSESRYVNYLMLMEEDPGKYR